MSRDDKLLQLARHLRMVQIIWDDGPDDSDRAQADLHLTAAVLLSKQLVPYGQVVVTDADAREVVSEYDKISAASAHHPHHPEREG